VSAPVVSGIGKPQYYLPGTVYDAALNRVRWLFEEFNGHVSVSCSGGKDSTVVVELARIVARERGAGPLRVHFLDQEAEYQGTIDYMRRLREQPDVDLEWFQIPFRLFNAASHADEWTYCWDVDLPADQWMRHKEPDSIHVNDFVDGRGRTVDRFKDLLGAMNERTGGAILTGMRCEESPTRRVFMTSMPSYKWVTWAGAGGKVTAKTRREGPSCWLFHPIYDWSYRDVWKAINQGEWDYNVFYDKMFRHGVPLRNMRVSSFCHEESMGSLDYLQELEPETWEKAVQRYKGVNTYAHVGDEQFEDRHRLPYMFGSYQEYWDHLVDKLIPDPVNQQRFHDQLARARRGLSEFMWDDAIVSAMVGSVISNDVYGSSVDKWIIAQRHPDVRAGWLAEKQRREARAFANH
jgi:predicted phosphoadenosine phosphosulfate sulfurtransferase